MEKSAIASQTTDRAMIARRAVLAAHAIRPFYASLFEGEDLSGNGSAIRNTTLLHPALIALGAALLMAAFATDIVYWWTLATQWENFSIWLITGGMIIAVLSGAALLLDFALKRISAIAWPRFAVIALAALLSLLNAFVHSRDAYTAVVPQGLELSGIVTVLLLLVGWRGWNLAVRSPIDPSSNASQQEEPRP